MDISQRDARRLFLSRQGLLKKDHFGRGQKAVKRVIDEIAWVQIDTISVVERAHHHVLKTRVRNYSPRYLDRLQRDHRHIFEYWSHAAAYLPFSQYRYCLPIMDGSRTKRPPDEKLSSVILNRIREEGPLQSRDFEAPADHKSGGWWDWKPAKHALERLFLCGDLMVSHRDGFQKVYDLPERIIPAGTNTSMPNEEEWYEALILRMIQAHGLATANDIAYCRTAMRQLANRTIGQPVKQAIEHLVEDGKVLPVTVNDKTYYSTPELLTLPAQRIGKRQIHILSPFDNLVINRQRAIDLFDFDYQIECYVPEAKRQYGYFCLPILYGDELIGRLDAKAERGKRHLLVKNLFLEGRIKVSDALIAALQDGLKRFSDDNDCDSLTVAQTSPGRLKQLLTSTASR